MDDDLDDVHPTEADEQARTFLLYNFDKSDKVMQTWIQCFEYRRKKMEMYGNNIAEILLDWSIISKPFGVDLVIIPYF